MPQELQWTRIPWCDATSQTNILCTYRKSIVGILRKSMVDIITKQQHEMGNKPAVLAKFNRGNKAKLLISPTLRRNSKTNIKRNRREASHEIRFSWSFWGRFHVCRPSMVHAVRMGHWVLTVEVATDIFIHRLTSGQVCHLERCCFCNCIALSIVGNKITWATYIRPPF